MYSSLRPAKKRKSNRATAEIDLTQSDDEWAGTQAAMMASLKPTKDESDSDVEIIGTIKPATLKSCGDDSDVEIVGTNKPSALVAGDDDVVEIVDVKKPAATDDRKQSPKRKKHFSDEVECLGSQPATQFSPTKKKSSRNPFACAICIEDALPGHEGFTLSCSHRFCKECLIVLVSSKVNDKACKNVAIECPAPKCKTQLSGSEVQYILRDDKPAFASYAAKANVARLEQEATTKSSATRRCPAAHCNFIFVFEPGTGAEGTHFDCPQCHAQFCLQCGANKRKVGPAHVGMSCYDRSEQLKKELEERKKFEKWQKENAQADQRFQDLLRKEQASGKTMPCPSCGTAITKNGGCHHMHCSSCNKSFNWNPKQKRK